jgi:hypothetical protein
MIKPQDIEIEIGLTQGGDSMRVLHKPTGIWRIQGPPMLKPGKMQREMLRGIEAELIQKGLTQHLLPRRVRKR